MRGRVQGVGFRYFVLRRAQELGLAGWVRNNPDGTVEVEAEGEPLALEVFARDLSKGPTPARVARVEIAEISPLGSTDFEVV